MLDRAALAAAVRAIDPEDLASRRWFAAKGEVPSSLRLAHALPLAPDAALALVDVSSGERGERRDRYAIPFVVMDGEVREAVEGDGAWRALAAAIGDGRTIPSIGREPDAAPVGQVDAALVCRPSP